MDILFTRQRHEAKRAGLHWDYRMVVGDKAYSWATKKELPEPGKSILLHQQPVHTADYALSEKVIIPDGQYGAGVTTLDWVKKGKASFEGDDKLTLKLANGETFLIKKTPAYGDKAWLFRNTSPGHEKKAYYTRHKYKEVGNLDQIHIPDPVASQKHDGSHFFMAVDEEGNSRFYSRRPSIKGGYPDRTSQLPHLTAKKLPEFANHVFSVELIHTGTSPEGLENHPELSGILNSLPDRAIATQKERGPVRAVLLDVITPEHKTYGEKLNTLQKVEDRFGHPEILRKVKTTTDIAPLLERTRKNGDEGIIVTSLSLPEDQNVRYKLKNFGTFNLRVVGKTQEVDIHGVPKNSAGALILADGSGRIVGKVGTGFDRNERRDIWDNFDKNWRGKIIQVKAFSNNKGNIRHPTYNGEADGDPDVLKSA